MELMEQISSKLQAGRAKEVKELVQQAIDEGFPRRRFSARDCCPGMDVIGAKFKNNEIYVPDVLIAARADEDRHSAAQAPADGGRRSGQRQGRDRHGPRRPARHPARIWSP